MAYISAIHYITPKDCLLNSLKVVENTGQVDYAIKALEKLICITEGKLQVGMGFCSEFDPMRKCI